MNESGSFLQKFFRPRIDLFHDQRGRGVTWILFRIPFFHIFIDAAFFVVFNPPLQLEGISFFGYEKDGSFAAGKDVFQRF